MRKYFGTDGIRGHVGQGPITADFCVRLGRAAGAVLGAGHVRPKVLIGKDTRLSGYMLESAMEAGLSAAGVDVVLLGPMTTPAVAHLTLSEGAQAGVVISASHNPHHDNGIKFFSASGEKLPDSVELEIESALEQPFETVAPERLGRAARLENAGQRYVDYCLNTLQQPLTALQGKKVVLDCAHGAGYRVGPALLSRLGVDLQLIGSQPDGFNINAGCGATDLKLLTATVTAEGADLGVALDGDGDRLMLVTRSGRVVDGDDMIYLLASRWQSKGWLRGAVVGTAMTNFGIEQAIGALGLEFERAAVGDRYVLERMKAVGSNLGGEASGHVLCLDRATTGDALVTALAVFEALEGRVEELDQALAGLQRLPQQTVNVRLKDGDRSRVNAPEVQAARAEVEGQLAGRGRVVLRPSGTEPLLRVTVEGPDAGEVESLAQRLAAVVAG